MIDKQQLDAELTEILKHLPGWQLDPKFDGHCWCAVLIDGTGRGIHVNATRSRGRLYLSGMWPTTSNRDTCRPDKCEHVTIARGRPPEKIAADIQRRFLPWYTAAYAEEAERVSRQEAARDRQSELATELAALLGTGVRTGGSHNRIYASGLTVEVQNGGESVNIELHYTTPKIAKAVRKAFAKAGGTT